MNRQMTPTELFDFLYEKDLEKSCYIKGERLINLNYSIVSFLTKARADGVRVHATNVRPEFLNEPENNRMFDELCSFIRENKIYSASEEETERMIAFGSEVLKERDKQDYSILQDVKEIAFKGNKTLVLWGAGHFDADQYSLASISVSAGFYYTKEKYFEKLKDPERVSKMTDYSLFPADSEGLYFLDRTDRGAERGFLKFNY